jgi:non-heme chloroperoxidase
MRRITRSGRRTEVARMSFLAAVSLHLVLAGCGNGGPPPAGSTAAEGDEGTFVETRDGERIHYRMVGERSGPDQPALLFIPGWTMAGGIWEPQIQHFGRSHLVVAMDPRSQGHSSRARDGHTAAVRGRDIGTVVEALDLAPVVLVGWSMAVAEIVALIDARGTAGVGGLVLVDGVAGQSWDPEAALPMLQWMASFVHDREGATQAFVRGMYRKPHPEEYLRSVVEESLLTPTDAATALVVGAFGTDYRHALPGIDRPTLVVVAPGGPWDSAYAEMAEAIPDARLEWFEEAGHAIFVDEPDRFNALLEGFLADLSRAPNG